MREMILKAIEKNSRVDIHELAIMLGTDDETVYNEMVQMEKENIICGYHTMIDWDKTGIDKISALIEVKVTPHKDTGFEKIAEMISNYPEVNSVYLISGSYDILVLIEGKTLREVSLFVSEKLASIDSVLSTATHFVLRKYKDHGTVLATKPVSERMLVTP